MVIYYPNIILFSLFLKSLAGQVKNSIGKMDGLIPVFSSGVIANRGFRENILFSPHGVSNVKTLTEVWYMERF